MNHLRLVELVAGLQIGAVGRMLVVNVAKTTLCHKVVAGGHHRSRHVDGGVVRWLVDAPTTVFPVTFLRSSVMVQDTHRGPLVWDNMKSYDLIHYYDVIWYVMTSLCHILYTQTIFVNFTAQWKIITPGLNFKMPIILQFLMRYTINELWQSNARDMDIMQLRLPYRLQPAASSDMAA